MSTRGRVLSIILGVLILASIIAVLYITSSSVEERFTDFYILGSEGKAKDYPTELAVGEEATVLVGIVNHEHQDMGYRVVVTIDGQRSEEIGPVILEPGEKWEQPVAFTPTRAGLKQNVEFLLYREDSSEQGYASLNLWVNVKEKE